MDPLPFLQLTPQEKNKEGPTFPGVLLCQEEWQDRYLFVPYLFGLCLSFLPAMPNVSVLPGAALPVFVDTTNPSRVPASRHRSLGLPPSRIPSLALGTAWSRSPRCRSPGSEALEGVEVDVFCFPLSYWHRQVERDSRLLPPRPRPARAWAYVTKSFLC